MPALDPIPVQQGLTKDEVKQKLEMGWVLIGRQSVNLGVATPGSPGGTQDFDLWMLPEPQVPQNVVVTALVKAHQQGGGFSPALDSVCRMIFQMPIEELIDRTTQLPPEGKK